MLIYRGKTPMYIFFVCLYLHVLQKSAFTTYIICDTTKTDID